MMDVQLPPGDYQPCPNFAPSPEALAERSAIVEYMQFAADEADRLAGKASTEAVAAIFRAVANTQRALAETINSGIHLEAKR